MGFRYRRSFSLARGIRLNVTGRGVTSVSVGRPGATLNFSGRGIRPTIGLPGTGFSYTGRSSSPLIMVIGLALAGVAALFVQAARGSKIAQVTVTLLSAAAIGVGIMNHVDRRPESVAVTNTASHVARASSSQELSPALGSSVNKPFSTPPVAPIAAAPDKAKMSTRRLSSGPLVKTATVLDYANVRAAPQGAVVGQLAAGEQITVIAVDHGWFKVGKDGTDLGWIHGSLVAINIRDQATNIPR